MGPERLKSGAIRRQHQLYVCIGWPHVWLCHQSGPPSRLFSSFTTFPPLCASIHTICTTPGPCSRPPVGLGSEHARFLTSGAPKFAPFRENPQRKPLFLALLGHLQCVNTGIRTGNTICCALYLTHPTEGVTFTTAILDIWFSSLPKIADASPARSQPRSAIWQESRLKSAPTYSTQ